MELILWRHADAEMSEPDATRELTPKGRKQAQKMAEWLDSKLPSTCRILVSPATRAVQTAEALHRRFKILPDLEPGLGPQNILHAANWPHGKEPVLIIGHQPTLGQVAAKLIGGEVQYWDVRKAAVWWIAQHDSTSITYLKAVMTPDLVK